MTTKSSPHMERIVVVRPLKVISFLCCCITIILLIVCLASTFWLETDGYRQGIWKRCVSADASVPLPYNTPADVGCSHITDPERESLTSATRQGQ
ncbi:PREDICTED: uncharacterized protein LOC106808109 [Priapulus caudatus]|uniref:Uncharacterized protein LOC106808109 n=1 Tax=Priapulus caudatus TaxID=37621 RepID=A0ABM1E1U9_PRICU|nr:PREDICTED: uncharacterized protein LOC106808109 [Priapulus caudatus]